MTSETIAVIDLGSNSARLVLMDVFPDRSYKLVDELRESLRLGDHLTDDRLLTPEAVERTVEAAQGFAGFCKAQNVSRVAAVATNAMRVARNGGETLQRVFEETGLSFEIISGEQEAFYDYLGVVNTLNVPNCVILDVGGGSAEIIRVCDRAAARMTSLPLGAITLTTAFLDRDRSSPEQLRRLESYLALSCRSVPWLGAWIDQIEAGNPKGKGKSKGPGPGETDMILVGLGGTARNLAKRHRRRIAYPLDLLHGLSIPADAVHEIYSEIKNLSLAQRKELPGLSASRADIIVAGAAAFSVIAETLGATELVVSGRGLREGLFLNDLLGGTLEGSRVEDPANGSTRNLMRYHNVRAEHAEHVESLALSLFDQLAPLHGMGPEERRLLGIAALLHDVGIAVSFYSHGEHGLYLLTHTGIDGLTHRELVIVAYAVASHAGESSALKRWPEYRSLLSDRDVEAVARMGGILRLCEALDRNEAGSVRDLSCEISADGSQVRLRPLLRSMGCSELRAARGSTADLEKALAISIEIGEPESPVSESSVDESAEDRQRKSKP